MRVELAVQLLSTDGMTIWEVRDVDDRRVRFDGHPNGFWIHYQEVLRNLNLRPEVVEKNHIIVRAGDPEIWPDCGQAKRDREREAARLWVKEHVAGGTYPLPT